MKQFAKLFETEEFGQILVVMDAGDEGPEVRFTFRPEVKGFGLCSVAISGKDTPEGWKAIEEAFSVQTQETAVKVVESSMKEIREMSAIIEAAEEDEEP
jgi:hypothetical protein